MDEMVPWVTAVVMVEVPEEPLVMVRDVGLAPMVKLDGAAVTVRLTVVVSTVVSLPVPVTVTVVCAGGGGCAGDEGNGGAARGAEWICAVADA